MQLTLKDDLPFTRLKVVYRGDVIEITVCDGDDVGPVALTL